MSDNAPVETQVKSLLFAVKKELTITGIEHDIWLIDLLDRAASRLNTTERVVPDCCTIEVEDNRFEMPHNAKEVFAFRGVGNCFSGIFIDTNFFTQCGCSVTGAYNMFNALNRRGRWFYFLSSIPDGGEYEIAFTKVNRDCDGMMIINEECEEALISYTCWRFANAFRRTNQYTQDQVNTWYRDYNFQSAKCRGNSAVRTKNHQMVQISSKFNAILSLDGAWSGGWFGSIIPAFWYTNNPMNPYGI